MFSAQILSTSKVTLSDFKYYRTITANSKEMKIEIFNQAPCCSCGQLVKTDTAASSFSNPGQNVLVFIEDTHTMLVRAGLRKVTETKPGKLTDDKKFICKDCALA